MLRNKNYLMKNNKRQQYVPQGRKTDKEEIRSDFADKKKKHLNFSA